MNDVDIQSWGFFCSHVLFPFVYRAASVFNPHIFLFPFPISPGTILFNLCSSHLPPSLSPLSLYSGNQR